MHPVVELIARRKRDRSEPGYRKDAFRLALVAEGGAMRGVVSSGMLWALEEAGLLPCFDLAVGCSAGAMNLSSFLAGVAGASAREYAGAFSSPKIIRPIRALWGRPIIDLEAILDHSSEALDAGRLQRVLECPIPLHCVATDIDRARRTLLSDFQDLDEFRHALMASSCLPLFAGKAIEFRGRHYLDGGITEAIPVASARELGATHALVLQTRPRGLRYPTPKGMFTRLVENQLGRFHPVLPTLYHRRNFAYDETCDHLDIEQAKGDAALPSVYCLRLPEGSPSVAHLERRPEVLRERAEAARDLAKRELTQPVMMHSGKK